MESVTNFEYDIFISYAHDDNTPMTVLHSEGWVKMFRESLKHDLKRVGEKKINIWWDKRTLDKNEFFDSKIEEGVKKSAIMLCINSPNYQQSDYCAKELEIFYTKAKKEKEGLKMGHKSRIVNVNLFGMPFKDWPEELEGREGFRFHEEIEEGEDWRSSNPLRFDSTPFIKEMTSLRISICKLLDDFKNTTKEKEETIYVDTETDNDFTAYFGDAPESLLSTRKMIMSSLQKKGYRVILNGQEAKESMAHEQATQEILSHANLAVHLLDQYPGPEIDGDSENWYRKKQIEIAFNTPIPQLIWMSSQNNLEEIEPKEYKDFINGLEQGSINEKEYEFIIGDKGTLSKEIMDFVDILIAKKEALKKTSEVDAHEELDILLDYNVEDKQLAMELQQTFDKYNFITHYAPLGQDPTKNKKILHSRMNEVKKMVFLYGKSSKEWVESRIASATNKLLFDESPVEDIYVYRTPPHKGSDGDLGIKENANVNGVPINVINNEDLNSQRLEQFINNLKGE